MDSFATSIIYIVLKQRQTSFSFDISFATSIIYIVLKHVICNSMLLTGFATSIIYIVLKQESFKFKMIEVLLPA